MKRILPIVATLSLLAACSQETKDEVSAAAGHAKDAVASGAADFQKSASDALGTIDQKLGQLKSKASSASGTAKSELDQTLVDLDAKRKAIGDKLAELKSTAPEKAGAMVDKLKADMAALKQYVEEAAVRFK